MAGAADDVQIEVDPIVVDIAVDAATDADQDTEMLDADGPAKAADDVDEDDDDDDQSDSNDEDRAGIDRPSCPDSPTLPLLQENGRGYASATYFAPHDDAEQTRLAIQHQAYYLLFSNQLTLARLPSRVAVAGDERPLRILDIGTGPGDWALAVAEAYPRAEVVATDLTADAATADVPANLTFNIEDAREPTWAVAGTGNGNGNGGSGGGSSSSACEFDFVHLRGLSGALTPAEWHGVYSRAHACLAANGLLEVADWGLPKILPRRRGAASNRASSGDGGGTSSSRPGMPSSSSSAAMPPAPDGAGAPDDYLSIYTSALLGAAEQAGTPLSLQHFDRRALAAAGLAQQLLRGIDVHLGTGGGGGGGGATNPALGQMALIATLEGLEALALRLLTRERGWTATEVRELVERVKGEILAAAAEGRAVVECRVLVARKIPL